MKNFKLVREIVRYLLLSNLCSTGVIGSGADSGDVYTVGSVDGMSEKGLPQVGTSFLLHEITSSGSLFAISAYFVERTDSTFQIWRPEGDEASFDNSSRPFRLIWQMTATPSVTRTREDIYMEAKFLTACALVRPRDWFGVVQPTAPAAIGALFQNQGRYLPKINEKLIDYSVGMEAHFDMGFIYPFTLLTAAYLFTDLQSIFGVNVSAPENVTTVTCPSGYLVPSWINVISSTTTPMVTFLSGATGATGQIGKMGPTGASGINGDTGIMGATGPTGQFGQPGLPGALGSGGATGQMGLKGRKGIQGTQGFTGPSGMDGDTGQRGPQGPPGNNTYQYDSSLPPLLPLQNAEQTSDGGLADQPSLRMGAIIWLALLSAMVVACATMLVFVCYLVADDKRIQSNEAAWIGSEMNRHT